MINTAEIVSSFGEAVLFENLDIQQKYLYSIGESISDTKSNGLVHLHESCVNNNNELYNFMSSFNMGDVDLNSKNLPRNINNTLLAIYEHKKFVNTKFSVDNPNTWCRSLNSTMKNCLSEFEVLPDSLCEELDPTKIRKVINDMDDNSLVLLYGLVTGDYAKEADDSMRRTVIGELNSKGLDSEVGRVLRQTLGECSSTLGKIMEEHSVDLCESIQSKVNFTFISNDIEYNVSRLGYDKYHVSKI